MALRSTLSLTKNSLYVKNHCVILCHSALYDSLIIKVVYWFAKTTISKEFVGVCVLH